MFRLLKNLDQAIEEGRQPQEPLEKSCHHDCTHNSDIDDLSSLSRRTPDDRVSRIGLTSAFGQGSVMAWTPFSLTPILMKMSL